MAKLLLADTELFAREGSGAIQLRRPVLSHEWRRLQVTLQQARSAERRSAPLFTQSAVQRILENLRAIAEWFGKALLCPVCASPTEARSFQPLDRNTYRIECDGCQTVWGLRPCACGEVYPFLQVHSGVSSQRNSGRSLARALGRDVFAIPCSNGISEAFVCTHCGNCGKFKQGDEACVGCRNGVSYEPAHAAE